MQRAALAKNKQTTFGLEEKTPRIKQPTTPTPPSASPHQQPPPYHMPAPSTPRLHYGPRSEKHASLLSKSQGTTCGVARLHYRSAHKKRASQETQPDGEIRNLEIIPKTTTEAAKETRGDQRRKPLLYAPVSQALTPWSRHIKPRYVATDPWDRVLPSVLARGASDYLASSMHVSFSPNLLAKPASAACCIHQS